MQSNKILIIILYTLFVITGCKSKPTNLKNQNIKKEENKKTNNISKEEQEHIIKLTSLMLMMFQEVFKNTKQDIDPKKYMVLGFVRSRQLRTVTK